MTIRYLLYGNEVLLPYSEDNERIAKMEADNGEYAIVDMAFPELENQ